MHTIQVFFKFNKLLVYVLISEEDTANVVDCKPTVCGVCYTGKTSITASGRMCQKWDRQSPHSHANTKPTAFPDASMAEAANYCRNPDGEPSLWCYTTDSSERWEYCDIPVCRRIGNYGYN